MQDSKVLTAEEKQLEIEKIQADKRFVGHPVGVLTIGLKFMCNSFSYYGLTSILIYYLYAALPEGLGLTKTEASQLLSLYYALVIICGVIGSYMADRVFGPRTAIRLTCIVMPIAYLLLAIPGLGIAGYAGAQGMMLFSSMLGGRSMDALTAKLYKKGDTRKDSAFAITYVISNIGACVPGITGTIALVAGYHTAFLACAVFSLIGSIFFIVSEKKSFGIIGTEPDDPLPPAERRTAVLKLIAGVAVVAALLSFLFTNRIITITQFANAVSSVGVVAPVAYLLYIMLSPKTTKEERARLVYIIPMFIAVSFTLLVNYQATTVLAIYAETNVNRNLFGFEITPAAYWTLNAFFAVIFGAVLTGIWEKLGKKQPSTPAKMGIGTALYGISILFMIIPFKLFPSDVKVSPMWLVVFFAIMTIGEAIVTPAGESAASHVAPAAFSTQMMTVWAMGQSTGASLSSLVVNFYREGSESLYFLAIGAAVTLCGAIVVVFSKKLAKGMGIGTGHGEEQ